jgi:5'-3' exonuclease
MQLVSDRVVMFDTMKDKKIGRAEVIEKFGVPPEKVIEVQALIGDSTDNVPGVPGIGVKTAAQLIGEYGDLETLLFRVPEIKQEKRRQSLIDNAEAARMSKKLVTLDDQCEARRADRRSGRARAGLQAPDRVSQGDGVQLADEARRRLCLDRCRRRSNLTSHSTPAQLARSRRGEGGAAHRPEHGEGFAASFRSTGRRSPAT